MLVTNIFAFPHNVFKRLLGSWKSFSKLQNLDYSRLKEFAEDNFKFYGNGVKFSIRVETFREKEKLLVTSKFFFSHKVFIRLVLQTRKNMGLFRIEFIFKSVAAALVCALHQDNVRPISRIELSSYEYHLQK